MTYEEQDNKINLAQQRITSIEDKGNKLLPTLANALRTNLTARANYMLEYYKQNHGDKFTKAGIQKVQQAKNEFDDLVNSFASLEPAHLVQVIHFPHNLKTLPYSSYSTYTISDFELETKLDEEIRKYADSQIQLAERILEKYDLIPQRSSGFSPATANVHGMAGSEDIANWTKVYKPVLKDWFQAVQDLNTANKEKETARAQDLWNNTTK